MGKTTLIDRLASRFDGPSELARALGVRVNVVTNWKMRGRIPAHMAAEVERVSGGAVLASEVIQEAHQYRRATKSGEGRQHGAVPQG
jgi:DNA-binding transcriptional regulator YdaS (Cro superfamily)